MYLDSVLEFHSLDDLGEPAEPPQPPPLAFGTLAELEHHGKQGATAQAALAQPGPVADRGKGRFNRVGSTDALPVLGRKVEEVHQLLAVLDQLPCGLFILDLMARKEMVESRHGSQYVGGLADPATLVPGGRVDMVEGRPEPHGSVSDCQSRGVHAPTLQVQ